jgi:hypothetical protein
VWEKRPFDCIPFPKLTIVVSYELTRHMFIPI